MKLGASISGTAHAAILLWGAFSLQSVKSFEVAQVDALPIDIIPIESITQSIKGDPKASLSDTPAPKPTKKPALDKPAENVGDSKSDIAAKTEAPPKPIPVEANSPPPKPEPQETKTPVPTEELASLSEPAAPVPKEKIEEAPAKAEEAEKFAKLPDSVPLPVSRPRPPKPKTAKTPERKKPKKIVQQKKKSQAQDSEKSADDQIAALLNKQDATATGAKRSTTPASLGSKKSNGATRLSRSEMDALRAAIEQCWTVPIGLSDAEEMRVTIRMRLARDGTIDGRVNVEASGGASQARRAFAESARRAVLRCAPYNLPNDKYDTWSRVVVNFDPSQMF